MGKCVGVGVDGGWAVGCKTGSVGRGDHCVNRRGITIMIIIMIMITMITIIMIITIIIMTVYNPCAPRRPYD
jgi:hypothetical protein